VRFGSKAKATRQTSFSQLKRSSFVLACFDPLNVSTAGREAGAVIFDQFCVGEQFVLERLLERFELLIKIIMKYDSPRDELYYGL